jgi:hypothetical protein
MRYRIPTIVPGRNVVVVMHEAHRKRRAARTRL